MSWFAKGYCLLIFLKYLISNLSIVRLFLNYFCQSQGFILFLQQLLDGLWRIHLVSCHSDHCSYGIQRSDIDFGHNNYNTETNHSSIWRQVKRKVQSMMKYAPYYIYISLLHNVNLFLFNAKAMLWVDLIALNLAWKPLELRWC